MRTVPSHGPRKGTPPSSQRFCRRSHFESLEKRELLAALVWASGPSLPEARTAAVAIVAPNDAVYLLGGDSASPMETPRLSPGATSWDLGHNIDTSRDDLGAVRTGNSIYLFGGGQNGEGTGETLAYDYVQGDSQDLSKMNLVRYDLGYAADADGRAYAIGGIGIQEDGELWSEVERYDPATGAWSAVASLPQPLRAVSAIGDGNGHIFVFGGSSSINHSVVQNTSYRYDIATDTWSTIAPMPIGTQDSAVVADDSGAIYLIGGLTTTGATDAVQVYDSSINAWTIQTSLPEPLYSHAATYDSLGQIIVAGGFDVTSNPSPAVYRTQRLDVAETAPIFTTSAITTGSLDAFYTYPSSASGNPAPTYSLLDSPAGMTIDGATGLVSWQPVAGQVGVHPVTIRASNTTGAVDQSFDVTVVADTIAPTAPSNVTVDSVTETTVTLNWDASTDAVGVDRYEVSTARYEGPRFAKRWVYTLVDTVTSTTSTITGLTPFSSTNFSIQAFDAAGNASLRSPRMLATTLSEPTLTFSVGTQTTGTVIGPALHPLEIQLHSRANPDPTFSIVNGPQSMTIDPSSGLVRWTPAVAEMGVQTLTFRAENSVGMIDLDVVVDIISDAPQLSVTYNPTTGGDRFAVAGTLFRAQVNDASQSASTYQLMAAPTGMTIEPITGLVSWTANGDQGGTHPVTVRATNAGGTADLTFDVLTHFVGPVTGVTVTGQTLLTPTATWTAPAGEGAELVDSYNVNAYVRYRYGSHTWRTHTVDYTTSIGSEAVELVGLLTGKNYTLTITPIDAAGNTGLANRDATVTSIPALPQVGWTVNSLTGGSSVPGRVIADQPVTIVLTDRLADPSTLALVSGPTGLTFDPITNTADWTPGAADVTTGYTTTDVTFEATNSVGSVNVVVPIRVFFSGTVHNASATKLGTAVTVRWDPPTDNVKPIAGYQITAHWTWSGRPRSSTRTVGNVTSASYAQYPTGAVSHKGVRITAIDADGNFGVESDLIEYGAPPNGSAPVGVDDTYNATEDTSLSVDFANGVLTNDTDIDGNPLTARISNLPTSGTVTLSTNGSFDYTPNANFNGPDSFTYLANDGAHNSAVTTVTVNVTAVNDTPAALYDYYTTDSGTSIDIDAVNGVLHNDNDIDGDSLSANYVSGPANGTITLYLDGSFVYTPNEGFVGTDTFSYVANDGTIDSLPATVSIAVQATDPIGEAGSVLVAQADAASWTTVVLDNDFFDPVVIVNISSFRGTQPSTLRVRNLVSNSFEIQIDEWDYLDAYHVGERVDYLVVEAGTHTLPDGTRLQAGKQSVDHIWSTVSLGGSFSTTPVVFSQSQTHSGAQAIVQRHKDVSSSSFDIRLQEEEANDGYHATETVGWVAVEVGANAGTTGNVVTDDWYGLPAAESLVFLASMQTFDGPDPAAIRARAAGGTMQVKLEEEQSADTEVVHTTEVVGYFSIAAGHIKAAASPLLAYGDARNSLSTHVLTIGDVEPLIDDAIAAWATVGISADQHDRLNSLQVSISNLSGARLAEQFGNTITLDVNAAGYGWQLDSTDPLANRIDPLTVIYHEMGHAIGLDDDYSDPNSEDVMNGWLSTDTQREPTIGDLDVFFGQNEDLNNLLAS